MDRGALLSKAHGNTGGVFFDSTSGGALAKKNKNERLNWHNVIVGLS